MKKRILAIIALLCIPLVYAGAAKISGLTALTAPAVGDQLVVVDVSDTTQAATGTSKYITAQNLFGSLSDSLLSATTVSFAADGQTTLFTVPTGKRAVLTKVIVVAAADCGSTDFTIGQVGALTDFLGTQQTDNLNAQYDAAIFQPIAAAIAVGQKSYAATTVIQIDVANNAGAAGNTVYLFGFLY